MDQVTGADIFVRCLENEGVEYIFGLPGEEIRDLMVSLKKSKIKFIMTRHEQGAAFMADVYGRLTGRAGVCLSTLGPGATNLITGVADAQLDHAPLVAITGQGSLERLHKESHQIIDIVNMFKPVTLWNTRLSKTKTIPEVVRKAFKVAEMEKPGATHIEISEDIAGKFLDPISPLPRRHARRAMPDRKTLEQAIELLKHAKKPLILAGNGAIRKRASQKVRTFTETTGIYVVSTFMGKGSISDASELSLFTIGLGVDPAIYNVFDAADLIIAIGYDIGEVDPAKWNRNHKKILHIDFAPAEVYEYYVPEVELVADISSSLSALMEAVHTKYDFPEAAFHRKKLETAFAVAGKEESLTPERILLAMRQVMKPNDILISDVGSHKMWIGTKFPTYEAGSVIISNGFASMGIALPGAISAKLAKPQSNIFAVVGDGGFLMNVQEIETAKRLDLAFPVIIFNDRSYSLIEEKFRKDGAVTDPLTFENPDFALLAKSFGVSSVTVKKVSELEPALREALKQNTVCLVDIHINPEVHRKLFNHEAS